MKEYQITKDDTLHEQVGRDFPGYNIVFEESLMLPVAYLDQIKNGTKTTTIKFKEKAFRLPRTSLPAIEKESKTPAGRVSYKKVVIKHVGELNETDAVNDGFATLGNLRDVLREAYGELSPESLLSIHYFDKFDKIQ